MPKPKSIKKAYQDSLTDFRNKHIKEMERNMKVEISIRDNEKNLAKDRNEAVKIISRMLSALQPDKSDSSKSAQQQAQKIEALTDSEIADIERRLSE